MKSSISSLLGSKNLNIHHSTFSPSHRRSSILLSKSITHLHPTPFNFIISNPKFKFQSLLAPIMASSFKPEQSRPPPVTQFKIGLCQLLVTAGKERNIEQARKAIEEAAGKGAQLVVLPIWSYWYRYLLWHLISGTGNAIGSKRAADNQLYVATDSPARDLDLVMWMGPLHSTPL